MGGWLIASCLLGFQRNKKPYTSILMVFALLMFLIVTSVGEIMFSGLFSVILLHLLVAEGMSVGWG